MSVGATGLFILTGVPLSVPAVSDESFILDEPDELEESEPDESVTGWKSSVAANPVVSI